MQPKHTGVPSGDGVRASRYRANVQAELDRVAVYRAMADGERDERLAATFHRLADSEQGHADFWRERLTRLGGPIPDRPTLRARVLAGLARRVGSRLVLPAAASLERAEKETYEAQPEAADTGFAAEEREHRRAFDAAVDASRTGIAASVLNRVVGRRHSVTGNALRAAVLGANDGLVSNLSLVMGAAGASFDNRTVLITGLAGLLAGAFSMAMGEWISVKSSSEMHQQALDREAAEIAGDPEHERAELVALYQRRGLTVEESERISRRLMADSDAALDVMARDELGIDPNELGGSAMTAAVASFLLFVCGAIVPVSPFVFADGDLAVAISLSVSAVALLAIGGAITLLTGRSAWRSALRQLAIGIGAAIVTYGAGALVGGLV